MFNNECEDKTVIYPPGALEALIADSCPHRHATVRAMNAVKSVLRKLVP